jgi:prepilin peptidase CpaA
MLATALTVVFVAVMVMAAVTDFRSRRIPNPLTIGGLTAAFLLQALLGWPHLLAALEGLGVACLVALPLLALGGLGGGDAKLLMAAGAFMGPLPFARSLLAVALVGGALALGKALFFGQVGAVVVDAGRLLLHLVTFGRRGRRASLSNTAVMTIPYGIAIALGCIWGWFL